MTMKKAVVSFLILMIFFRIAIAQEKTVTYLYDAGSVPQDKIIDITHLKAELFIDPYDTLVTGSVTFTFLPVRTLTDSIILWSPDILFSEVQIPGIEISYLKKGDNLVIYNLSKKTIVER